jgi:hypothetical protein
MQSGATQDSLVAVQYCNIIPDVADTGWSGP